MMKNIWGELGYNLKKGFLIDLVLAAQCLLAAWLFITLISYYSHWLVGAALPNVYGDYGYYSLSITGTDEQVGGWDAQLNDPQYVEKLRDTVAQLKADSRYTYMAVDFNQSFPVSNRVFEKYFGGPVPDDFLNGSLYPGYWSKPENRADFYPQPHSTHFFSDSIEPNPCRIDENAFAHYHLRVSEGRPFVHEDFTLGADQAVPLLLGDAYRPYFTVGDRFDVDFIYIKLPVEVIGFLTPHSDLVSDQFLPFDGHPVSLDYDMVYPLFDRIERPITTWEEREYAAMNYEGFLEGTLVTDAATPRWQVTQIERDLNDLYLGNGLFPMHLQGSPEGLILFQMETQQSVAVMTGMMAIVLIFTLLCIFLCLAAKIERNLKRYATQLMLGQSLLAIWGAYLLEILLVCLVALWITALIFLDDITLNPNYLGVMLGLYGAVSLLSSLIILWRLRKLDIEILMRRAE